MKVVHIATSLMEGGMQTVLQRLVVGDTADDHVVISLLDEGAFGPRLRADGIEVHALDMPRGRLTISGLRKLWRLLRQHKPDAVQTWLYHADLIGGLFARLATKARICWGLHFSYLNEQEFGRATRLVLKLCAWTSGLIPHRVISCSEKGRLLHLGRGYNANRLMTIQNGYDFSLFQPNASLRATTRQALGIADGTLLIGQIARWDPMKDHANMMAGLAQFNTTATVPWRCILAGDSATTENTDLMTLIAEHRLQEHVIPLGQRSDIPGIMNALDIKVLSSVSGEAFPNVLVEAMASGTPCVTTDLGDSALIVDKYGKVVPTQDPDALATAIGELVQESSNPEAWQQRCDGGRDHVSQFSLERMVNSYRAQWLDENTQ
jgi:glycosyltransferase involved in cell wall biosynthesis